MNQVRLLNLTCYPQPETNRPFAVADAFDLLITACDAESSRKAHGDMLYALGNAHAGTYCPIVVRVIPLFGDILSDGAPWAQYSVMEVLIDLCSSFRPEFVYRDFQGEPLQRLVIQAAVQLLPVIRPLTETGGVAAKSAVELCELLQEWMPELQSETDDMGPG